MTKRETERAWIRELFGQAIDDQAREAKAKAVILVVSCLIMAEAEAKFLMNYYS